ncbi:MAG: DUF3387 domain-containing protein [Sulfurospirillum sp.]|nr:DUF3387 domain-containing protein [Sulfurospirillum sp.]
MSFKRKKFSDRLQATMSKYHNRAIETAKVIEELIAMAKDFSNAMKHGEDLGLNYDEVAFYDALAENESALKDMSDEILKKNSPRTHSKIAKQCQCRLAEKRECQGTNEKSDSCYTYQIQIPT